MNALLWELPSLREPVAVTEVEIYRDGGSVDVTLRDFVGQTVTIWFDHVIGSKQQGQMCLRDKETKILRPIAVGSNAEQETLLIIRQHLDQHYSAEEQTLLSVRDGRHGFRNISRKDYNGFLLLRCLQDAREYHKLVTVGVVRQDSEAAL